MTNQQPVHFLSGLLQDCAHGHGRIALISGPMAVGKTAVSTAFIRKVAGSQAVAINAAASAEERTTPLGVVMRLLRDSELTDHPSVTDEWRAGTAELSRACRDATAECAGDPAATSQDWAALAHRAAMALLELARALPQPLVVMVDDAHNADVASLQCLSIVARRLDHARLLLIVTTAVGPSALDRHLLAHLPPAPTRRSIRMDVLSERGVEAMLAQALGADAATRLAAGAHRISGGNPRLVRGLIEDNRKAARDRQRILVGQATGQAMRATVQRCDAPVRRIAQALAVLGSASTSAAAAEATADAASPMTSIAAQLAGLDVRSAAQAVDVLTRGGLLDDGRFRHSRLRRAVLEGIEAPTQAVLHAQAAQILHRAGASVTAVADHAVAAGRVDGSWVTPALHEAAEQALADGQVARAVGFLRLAYQMSSTDRQRAAGQALLADAEWRLSPTRAVYHLGDLTAAVHAGHLTGPPAFGVAMYLAWIGRAVEARTVLGRAIGSGATLGEPAPTQVRAFRQCLTTIFPATSRTAQSRGPLRAPAGGPFGGADQPLACAEHLLQETRLDGHTFPLLMSAVGTLLVHERFDAAAEWCESFRKVATAHGAVTWHAGFTALRAAVALQHGDLVDAERLGSEALGSLGPHEWGVLVGLPLGVLVQAKTAMGRTDEAVVHLDTAVPAALFDTSLGAFYLLARGSWHLATDAVPAAMRDFRSVADLSRRWRTDQPAVLPWRIQVAKAHLRSGEVRAARGLVTEHLRLLPASLSGAVGSALRVLARCSEPRRRPQLLGQAVQELQNSGRRLELALALADLSEALRAAGQSHEAKATQRRARQIAKDCGMPAPALIGDGAPADRPAHSGATALSEAERRVATLAAEGFRNREIAGELGITVSTVEQHLTRVYSKLRVNRRTDLRPVLDAC
jgi:DNA-binding CsgD family transcriptional regulator